MTDKQIIIDGVDVCGCEYYFDEKCRCMDTSIMQDFYSCPQCNSNPNCYYKQLKRAENQIVELNKMVEAKEQECERLKKEVQQALKKNAENYSNSCLLQKEVNQLKEQIKRLQEDLKIWCDMYFKESYKNYKLSEISCEWNARSCIEKLEKFLMSDDLLIEKISNASNEIKRFFKECTPNKDKRLADFIPEDEYTKCLKAQQQLDQLKADREEALKQLEFVRTLNTVKEAEIRKLSQTLTEIKEICNKTVCDYLQCSLNYNHSKDFECEKTSCNRAKRRKFILQILQKISEVENV